jgi:hypothetical protein
MPQMRAAKGKGRKTAFVPRIIFEAGDVILGVAVDAFVSDADQG